MNIVGNAINELYRIFDILNNDLFNNDLPTPVITVYPTKGKLVGHLTKDKVWKHKDAINYMTGEIEDPDHNTLYEINIDPRWFVECDVFEVVHTLIHEMCHLANKVAGIEDCKGKSHTKDFKNVAQEVGLIVEKQRGIGWGATRLSSELCDRIETYVKPDENLFKYFREVVVEEKKPKKKNLFEYTCPSCGMVAKAKEGFKIICGMCNVELEMEEVEEELDETVENEE